MDKKYILLGFLLGFLSSLIGVILYIEYVTPLSFSGIYLEYLYNSNQLPSIISIGSLLNLFLFMSFINLRKDNLARGVLLATIVIALVVFSLKIF